jgi:hypothetical protein
MHDGADLFTQACALDDDGDNDSAVDLFRKAIVAGLSADDTEHAFSRIAIITDIEGRDDEAMDAYLTLIDLLEARDAHEVVGYYELAGELAAKQGDVGALEHWYERSIATQQRRLERAHPSVLQSYGAWARTCRVAGDEAAAARVEAAAGVLLQEVLDAQLARHPSTARVAFASLGVSLVRPAGFVDAPLFDGFICEGTHAVIMVQRVPAPIADQIDALTDEAQLDARFMALLDRRDGPLGPLLLLSQPSALGPVHGWTALMPSGGETVVVSAKAPAPLMATIGDALLGCVESAALSAPGDGDLTAGLDFVIDAPAPFQLGGRVGDALLFNTYGDARVLAPGEPLLVVAASMAPAPLATAEERRAFIEGRVGKEVEALFVSSCADVMIGNRPAARLRGAGIDDDVEIDVAAVVVFDHHRYWFGLVTAADPDLVDEGERALGALRVGIR